MVQGSQWCGGAVGWLVVRPIFLGWCVERDNSLVLVSRSKRFPIQIHLSGNVCAHQNPLGASVDPSGVGGYMRRGRNKAEADQQPDTAGWSASVRLLSLVAGRPVVFGPNTPVKPSHNLQAGVYLVLSRT